MANLFQPHRARPHLPPRASSVLAILVAEPRGELSFLFTRRTKTLSAFAGDLSFPGGRIDPTDPDPLATAFRETKEEIGLDTHVIRSLGHFTELETHFGTLVICYGGSILPKDVPSVPTSPHEVAEILTVPIDSLRRPGRTTPNPDRPSRYVATGYEGRRIGSPHAPSRTLHYWTLVNPHTREPTILWGLTAEIVSRFLRQAYDWTPPGPPRPVKTLDELQP